MKTEVKKEWINRAIRILEHSLSPIPLELNELDWKSALSPNSKKLSQHLSAFANQAGGGFLVFGIENSSGKLTGITREESEDVINKLTNIGREGLMPEITINHTIETYEDIPLLFIYIPESKIKPVYLKDSGMEESFIRVGGTTRKASRQEIGGLLLNSKIPSYEELRASMLMNNNEVLEVLDYRVILKLLDKPMLQDSESILAWLVDEKMIEPINGSGYYITNFGALSAAYSLKMFDNLGRKSIRVIKYAGNNKLRTEKEHSFDEGYAKCFSQLIVYIMALLPTSEVFKNSLRKEVSVFPEIALRELIANALIHQDFSIRGSGPMIEIFDDRIEITNPGKLLPSKNIDRLIRTTPESRNEILASAFRRYNICEERGSGLEKAVVSIESYGLPPLKFIETENSFRVTVFRPKKFSEMILDERIEVAYQHSIVKYFSGSAMTNSSLRERFKLSEKQRTQVSLVIKEALKRGRIKPKDSQISSMKFVEYLPYWG